MIFLLLVLTAIVFRSFPQLSGMGRDETSYAFLIKHFMDGTFLNDPVFYAFHPFFPLLSSGIARFGIDPELAGKIVSFIMSVGSVGIVYIIGLRLVGRGCAITAAFLSAVAPGLAQQASLVMSESTYTFFLLAGLLCAVIYTKGGKIIWMAMSSAAVALAYLTRAEGLGVFILGIVVAVGSSIAEKKHRATILKAAVLGSVIFLILASPYAYTLKKHTGEWKFSDKTRAQLLASVIQSRALDYDAYSYGDKRIPESDAILSVIKHYPVNSFKTIAALSVTSGILPLALAVGTLLVIAVRRRGTHIILIPFVPFLGVLAVIPFFVVIERIIIPYVPVIFLLAAYGISMLDTHATSALGWKKLTVHGIAIVVFALTFVIAPMIGPQKPPSEKDILTGEIYRAYRQFGADIRHVIPPGSKIMARNNMVAWYAGGEFVTFPKVAVSEFIDRLRAQRTDYIVFGVAEQSMRNDIYRHILSHIEKGADKRFSLVVFHEYENGLTFSLVKIHR